MEADKAAKTKVFHSVFYGVNSEKNEIEVFCSDLSCKFCV